MRSTHGRGSEHTQPFEWIKGQRLTTSSIHLFLDNGGPKKRFGRCPIYTRPLSLRPRALRSGHHRSHVHILISTFIAIAALSLSLSLSLARCPPSRLRFVTGNVPPPPFAHSPPFRSVFPSFGRLPDVARIPHSQGSYSKPSSHYIYGRAL